MLRFRTLVFKALYWLAVLVISLALLVLLVLFFESRDSSDLDDSSHSDSSSSVAALVLEHGQGRRRCGQPRSTLEFPRLTNRANTMIRWAALYSGWQALSTSRSYFTLFVTHSAVGSTIWVRSTL